MKDKYEEFGKSENLILWTGLLFWVIVIGFLFMLAIVGCVTSTETGNVCIPKVGTKEVQIDTIGNTIIRTTYTVNPDRTMKIERDTAFIIDEIKIGK